MGTYTNFQFDATLKNDLPPTLLNYIKLRLTRDHSVPDQKFDQPFDAHPFFQRERWHWVLTWHNCNGNGFKAWCKETSDGLVIHIDTELKNYCDSIEWFLLWIAPMVNLNFPCSMSKSIEGHKYCVNADCSDMIRQIQQQVSIGPCVLDGVSLKQLYDGAPPSEEFY